MLLLLRIALAIQGLLCFHMNFRTYFFYFCKDELRTLVGSTLNLNIISHDIGIFTILIMPFHEHGGGEGGVTGENRKETKNFLESNENESFHTPESV
jgi:hypothetical protein